MAGKPFAADPDRVRIALTGRNACVLRTIGTLPRYGSKTRFEERDAIPVIRNVPPL